MNSASIAEFIQVMYVQGHLQRKHQAARLLATGPLRRPCPVQTMAALCRSLDSVSSRLQAQDCTQRHVPPVRSTRQRHVLYCEDWQ